MSLFSRASAPRYAAPLLDRLPLGVAVYHLTGTATAGSLRLLYLNEAGERATGLTATDAGRDEVADETLPWIGAVGEVARTGTASDLGVVECGAGSARGAYAVQVLPLPDQQVAVLFESVPDPEEPEAPIAEPVEMDVKAALADGEARFRDLFDAISDVLLLYPIGPDGAGRIVSFNQAALDLYGYSADELHAMTVTDLVDGDRSDTDHSLDELRRTRQGRFESVHLTQDGRRIPMQVNARLMEFDGQLHALSVCRDDTERRQFQRDLTRNNLQLERSVQERTAEMEAFAADLKILHRITTADHASSDERVRAYLDAGCAMFDLPIGILSSLPEDPETGETLYRIEAVVSPEDAVPAGLTIPLADAFCDAVVAAEETVTYADAAGVEALSCHSAYAERGLRSFIGTPIWDGDALFGTLNFVSPEPRSADFAPFERELVEVMADAIGRRIRQERLEREQADADAWYRSVVETVAEGLVLIDRTGCVQHANPAACEILGLEPTTDGECGQARQEGWRALDADGQPIAADDLPEARALNGGGIVRGVLQGIARPDGQTRWYTVNATPLDRDGDGTPDVAVLSFSDVTDLRAARAVLAAGDQPAARA